MGIIFTRENKEKTQETPNNSILTEIIQMEIIEDDSLENKNGDNTKIIEDQ